MAKELSDKSQEEQRELDDLGKILKKRDKGTAIRVEEDFIYGKIGGREVMLMLRSKYDRYKKLLSKYKSPKKNVADLILNFQRINLAQDFNTQRL